MNWRAYRQFPIGPGAGCSVPPLQPASRLEFFDSVDQSSSARHVIDRQIAIEPIQAEPAVDFRMHENRLQLGGKIKVTRSPGDVERLDAQAVSRQNEPLRRFGPQGDGEHTA